MIPAELDARALLREGAAQLLDAANAAPLAELVRAAQVEIAEERETWEMGGRKVEAQRVALIVDAPAYVLIRESPGALGRVRDAFASAVRSFDTELAELGVFLRLQAPHLSWQRVYRQAPAWVRPEARAAEVHGAAVALGRACQKPRASAIMERAELEVASVGELNELLTRWVIRLESADFAQVDRSPELRALLDHWVRAAAASVRGRVGEVSFGVILPH